MTSGSDPSVGSVRSEHLVQVLGAQQAVDPHVELVERGGANALDFMDIGSDRYRIFRQGHRTELATDFFVFRED